MTTTGTMPTPEKFFDMAFAFERTAAIKVDCGGGYDIALLTNFLHHFDMPTCTALLRKVAAALNPAGRALILEFVPNEDRVSPPIPAAFSLMMLACTPAGDAYTLAQ